MASITWLDPPSVDESGILVGAVDNRADEIASLEHL